VIGSLLWENFCNFGVLCRVIWVYEVKISIPVLESWVRAAVYDTPKALAAESEGEDYSFLQFLGLKGDGMFSKVDLPKLGATFEIPVFIVQGSEDLVAIPEVARRYLESLTAPQKEFVLVPKTGHDPNAAMIDAAHKVMTQRVRPLAK